MSNKRSSIRSVFYVTIILAVGVICAVFGIYDYKVSESRQLEELQTQLERTADRLALNLATPLWNISPGQVQTIVDSELESPNVTLITVLDEDKSTVVSSRMKTDAGQIQDSTNPDTDDFLLSTTEVSYRNDVVGEVQLYLSEENLRRNLRNGLINTLFLTLLLTVTLCAVLGISLSRLVIRPVITLSDVAANMAKGNFDQPIDIEGRGELASLSFNLKRLQTSFQIAINRLRRANESQAGKTG
jgi:nitrate/nitrite-specific signal transduction histidine kinase